MTGPQVKIRIWDAPVRIFHWSIVGLMGLSWWSVEQGDMELHQWSGITVLTLVLARILWGFYGSSTARFRHFLVGPGRMIMYLSAIAARKVPPVAGHTPTGGWMIVLLLLLILLQPTLGLFATDDILFEGPLYGFVSQELSYTLTALHKSLFNILLVSAGLHILAALYYQFILREKIIPPMVTGWRLWHAPLPRPLQFINPLWALLTLGIVGAVVYQVILSS
ncbi:cytochrome b/b6 domain-containing protein [Govanella unica]|uniref:Cytochrome b/b6 domain-containing protein n=1 Tax=Govanella unica TaxID=2975056 RepID=A0A9X3TVZ7_9PROT|nr:cytochrome b/b6 domain-containing protein [Govania unica]MDA5192579.1 cytochrome b/b6 domain-containing protein [Govania unica]